MDETTTAREAVIEAARAVASAPAGSHAHDEARAELAFALAAYDRAERPRAVPTEPGAYYLEDGRPATLYRAPCGGLYAQTDDGDFTLARVATSWATDPSGEVERVPSLEEVRKLRDNLRRAETQVDIWYARARELVAKRDEALARVRYLEAERDALTTKGEEAARRLIKAQQQAQRAEDTVERVRDILAQRGALWPSEALQLIDDIVGDDEPAFRRREVTRG